MPIEFDDRGLRVFGHNVKGLRFYDWDRVLQQEIYLQDDNTLNIGREAIGGGPVISAGAWLGDDGGGVFRFQPDVPILISGGIITEYPDIATALGVAGSGDSVVIPPGAYDESITLVDGVRVVELVSGTVVIDSTSADVAVTTASGGYINVKEIRCTRSRDSDGKLYAVYANHDTGTCIVVAELIRAENTDTVSPGETFGVAMWGAGTLWVFAKRLEASLDGYQHVFGVDSADGTSYVAAVQILADGGTSEDSLVYGVRNSGGEQYIWARVEAQSEGTAWAGYCTFGEQHIWGDCVASGGAVRGAACEGGLQVIHGNVIGESTKGWMAVGAHVQEGTQRIFGSCRAIGTGLSYGIRLLQDSNAGVQEIWGNAIATGGTTSIGAFADASAQAGAVMQSVDGDVIGDDYGAQCDVGTQTVTGGRASGGSYDLYQTGGTLQIASVQYDTYGGTITLLAESINALIAELEDTTELTIAAGAVTITQSYHRVDTQNDDATDDLDTVNGGVTGQILVLRPENDARTVVVKHNTGNIWNPTAADITLDDVNDHVLLLYDGSKWCLLTYETIGGGAIGDHDHTGDVGDGGQLSHDTALTGASVSADDHHNEDHATRHNPVDGADPLVVAVPVDTGAANAEGASRYFVRSDHVHKLHDHDHTGDAGDGAKLDHGAALAGLGDDDHPQYSLVDGTRAFTGPVEIDIAAGDPTLALNIGGLPKWMLGVDDDDEDKFKINSGGALADPSKLELDASGNLELAGNVKVGGGLVGGDVGATVNPGVLALYRASGDPKVRFDIGGVVNFLAGIDDTDNRFKINTGTTLAADSLLALDDAGVLSLQGDVMASGRAIGLQAQLDAITIYAQTAALDLTNVYQDVAGVTTGLFTPTVNERALILSFFHVRQDLGTAPCNAADVCNSQVNVNGVPLAGNNTVYATGATGGAMVVRMYSQDLTAWTVYTIKVQGQNATGNRGRAARCQMIVWRLSR